MAASTWLVIGPDSAPDSAPFALFIFSVGVGRGKIIVPVDQRVHHRLAQRLFRQFRPFFPLHMLDDVFHIDLGKDVAYHIADHGINIPIEVPAIKNTNFLRAHEQSAGRVGADGIFLDVLGKQLSPGMGHLAVLEQVQVYKGRERVHVLGNFGSFSEKRPYLVPQIVFERKAGAWRFVKMDQPFLEKELSNFPAGHLLR